MVRRVYAVIPAAGLSRRMGRPKLLLPLGGQTVIARVLALLAPAVTETIVVCRRDDLPLCQAAAAGGAIVIQPELDPPDMRVSVEHALRWLIEHRAPPVESGWLLLPADHPLIEPAVLPALLAAGQLESDAIVVPTFGQRRGHPALWPWSLVPEVFSLPAEAGLNQLVRQSTGRVVEVPVESETILTDLDTPEDYERWRQKFEQ